MKVCTRCNEEKPLNAFCKNKAVKDGLNYVCKACTKARMDRWRVGEGREAYLEYRRDYYQRSFEANAAEKKRYRARHIDKVRAREKTYKESNPDKVRETKNKSESKRKQACPVYSLKCRMRVMLNRVFDRKGWKRTGGRSQTILGCTFEQLYTHLVSTALTNYGFYVDGQEMHIDHVVPLATAKTEEDVLRLSHFSNLQWLTPTDNLKKGSKVDA